MFDLELQPRQNSAEPSCNGQNGGKLGIQRGNQPFGIDCSRREERLNANVLEAAPDCAGQHIPCLRLAVVAFGRPAVAQGEAPIFVRPLLAPPSRAEQNGIIVSEHNRLVRATL